jgi:hypothetical protein
MDNESFAAALKGKRLVGLHEKLAEAHPKLRRGLVECPTCGRRMTVNSAKHMRKWWPKCCGYAMPLK